MTSSISGVRMMEGMTTDIDAMGLRAQAIKSLYYRFRSQLTGGHMDTLRKVTDIRLE